MDLDSIALWLGYGVMLAGGLALLGGFLLVIGIATTVSANKSLKSLLRIYDMKTLLATMRQLESEGKVSKKNE